MSYESDARARLSAVFLIALPASLLGACGDDVTNHYYNYYGEGGADDGLATAGGGGKSGGAGGKNSTSGSAGLGGGEDGGMPSEIVAGGGGAGGDDGYGPVVDPSYPDAPLDDTPTTEQALAVFEIGNRYWFAVSDEQRQKMNNRWGGGPGYGDPYQPGSSGLTTFVDHLWVTTAGEEQQTSHYGKVQVKVVGESTWRQWDEQNIPNLNVDADQFVKNQRIGGYEHLRFSNAQVGTIFRERLTAELFQRFDYPAPLTTYAWVQSNVWGPSVQIPYILVERYKRKFCERYADDFGGGCANMWEFVGDFLAYGHYPGPIPAGYAGEGGMEPDDQPSIFDVPDNCQLDTCDNARVKQLEANLADTPAAAGFKEAMSEFIDWNSFHRFQCLSWMLWIGDDTLHNNNNVVIVERQDGLFQYLPYSIDISLGQDWYQNTPLTGDNRLARGCQADESCWADTIATCEGMIEEFEAMKPRDILKSIYDELDEQGMLRPGDDNRYETLDNWFAQRLEVLSEELEYYRDPNACHYPLVDCGGYCDWPEYCPQQCVPPEPKPPIAEGGAGPIIIDPGMGGTFAAGGAGNVAGSVGVAGMAMGGDGGGPEPCPDKEEYRIRR